MGVSGTATYGAPCYAQAFTFNLPGRIGFQIGNTGSIQDLPENQADPSNVAFHDDNMVITTGMPDDPGGTFSYATVTRNGGRTLIGTNGLSVWFRGESGRYMVFETTNGDTHIQMTADIVADAVRLRWVLTNTAETNANIGLWYGASLGMLTEDFTVADRNGASQSHLLLATNTHSPKIGYVTTPSGRPPVTEQRYTRAIDPSGFPQIVDFLFSQTAAYGLRVDNGETPNNLDPSGQLTASEVGEFVLGNHGTFAIPGILGSGPGDATFPDVIIGDVPYRHNTAFIQKYPEIAVGPNQSRTIVQYFHTPWGVSQYSNPYGVTIDAPQLLAADSSNTNGLRPNPMTLRVYVDNVAGYAGANTGVSLNDVKVSLTLPTGMSPLSGEPFVDLNNNNVWDPGEPLRRTITTIAPKAMNFVDFKFESDGIEFGDLQYQVKVDPIPGPAKTLVGKITVATTPRVKLAAGANLVTFPWTFQDSSLEAVLGMQTPGEFTAYKWDPQQDGYVVATNAERGIGVWILANGDFGSVPLQSNPQTPPDISTGAPLIQLHSGWNLVANPYPYPIRLGELVGVSAAAPEQSHPWAQLVAQNFVSGSLVFWDVQSQDYVFIEGLDAILLPNRGHWVFVPTVQDLTVSYPPVFAPYLPGSDRSTANSWIQSERQWRLQLTARSDKSIDAQNYVGIAKSAADARMLRIMEPPRSPVHDVELSIEETINGRPTRVAQSLAENSARRQWKVIVDSDGAGTVTVTWPNVSTVPTNVRFRMTDRATGETRDMRRTSSYSFTADKATSRELTIEATPGGQPARAIIGNVIVTKAGGTRAPNAPFTISYTLSTDATTSVRILSGAGREMYTVSRGRADRAGENTVTWALKDNANRVVAPGSYRVEIIAETASGDRVRKVIPVNVIR